MREKEKKEKKKREGSPLRENIEMVLEVLIIVFFINTFLVQTFGVPTPSMEDNMLIGDHLFVDKVVYSQSAGWLEDLILPKTELKRGMIVVFKSPPEILARNFNQLIYVKRVIGVPGDHLKMVDNQIFINGEVIEEPYLNLKADQRVPTDFPPDTQERWWHEFPVKFRESVRQTDAGPVFVVPEKHYFCMGDNRNLSADSRIWGPVHIDHVIGKPWRIYWSYETTTDAYLNRSFFSRIKDTVINFFSKTRWNRTLKKY